MEFDVRLNAAHRPALNAKASFTEAPTLIGVTGKSGAGKTTLLRALAGLEEEASVSADWQCGLSPRVMMVFREPCLFAHLNAGENIALAVKHSSQPHTGTHTFAQLCRCEALLDRQPEALSAGEAQRVALARAMANQPDILLIDEGMGAIDTTTRRAILSDIKHYATAKQMRLVIVSHDLDDLALFADQLVLIKDGELVAAGAVQDVLSQYAGESGQTDYLSLLEGKALEPDPRYPYHRFECEGQTLYAHKRAAQGKTVRLVVNARQISLDTVAGHQSTQVNALVCTIHEVVAISAAELKVTLKRGETTLYAIISQLSRDRLNLRVGDKVTARFKLC